MTESETSAIPSAPSGAEEELWLTYLNYDQPIQQAVRRLGALSAENVDLFRGLLLKDRDRSRVKEYEAESIRRLQGQAFVGDEELQRTLIVLTAENPRFGEELKRLVAATGKPEKLDQAVAAIRSGKLATGQAPAVTKEQAKGVIKESATEPTKEPAKETAKEAAKDAAKDAAKESREAVVVPLHKERPAPVLAKEVAREEVRKPPEAGKEKRNPAPLVIAAAIALVAAVGVVLMVPGLIGGKNAPESRIATAPPAAQPAQAPVAPAQHASPPAVDIAMPAPAERNAPSPPLRPASVQPDTPASDASQPGGRSAPVAGSRYRVVRGDMLSDIAFQVYHDASKFRLIQAANPSIRNKDRILVDQVIFIPQDSR